jgi:hypothetical protein
MRFSALSVGLLASTLILLGACASQAPPQVETERTRGVALDSSGEVVGRAGLSYRAPNVDFRRYARVIVEPVQIYRNADANFGDATEQQKQAMAEFMQQEAIRALGPRATTTPGADVARLRLTLAGLEGNTPVAATASRIIPLGLVVNLTSHVHGAPGTFSGSLTYAAEFVDSRTDDTIGVFIQKRFPDVFDFRATLTSEAAQKRAFAASAEQLRIRIEEIQAGGGVPR